MRSRHQGAGLTWGLVLTLLASLAIAGSALAATAGPKKGKTYRGTIKRYRTPISFHVAKSGRSVGAFSISYAPFIFCQGGGARVKNHSVRISSKGTFKAVLAIYTFGGKPFGHMTITGKFGKGGRESGKVIMAMSFGASCNGSSPYFTRAG